MFENLKAEMARKCITMADFSINKDLNLSYESIRNKFNGKTEWNLREMKYIQKNYFPEKILDYLFEQN